MSQPDDWFQDANPGEFCDHATRCPDCQPDGICQRCDTVEGRNMEAVNEYASTCDGCGELTHHEELQEIGDTELGLCPDCVRRGVKIHVEPIDFEPVEFVEEQRYPFASDSGY